MVECYKKVDVEAARAEPAKFANVCSSEKNKVKSLLSGTDLHMTNIVKERMETLKEEQLHRMKNQKISLDPDVRRTF